MMTHLILMAIFSFWVSLVFTFIARYGAWARFKYFLFLLGCLPLGKSGFLFQQSNRDHMRVLLGRPIDHLEVTLQHFAEIASSPLHSQLPTLLR